jgi:hypothetical protein
MKYVEAPDYSLEIERLNPRDNLFLAGSITGAYDWQIQMLQKTSFPDESVLDKYNVFNPRRNSFDLMNKEVEKEQITWEYHIINNKCKNILFWFSHETLAPITLYEYGRVLARFDQYDNIFVGIHPEYKRKNDVLIQSELACGKSFSDKIVYSIEALREHVIYSR